MKNKFRVNNVGNRLDRRFINESANTTYTLNVSAIKQPTGSIEKLWIAQNGINREKKECVYNL